MKILNLFNNACRCSDTIKSPYIIAEVGVNHEADMNLAKRLIDEAKEGGADAVKFQTYKANTIASKDSPAYWDTTKEPIKSQFKLFRSMINFGKMNMNSLKFTVIRRALNF